MDAASPVIVSKNKDHYFCREVKLEKWLERFKNEFHSQKKQNLLELTIVFSTCIKHCSSLMKLRNRKTGNGL